MRENNNYKALAEPGTSRLDGALNSTAKAPEIETSPHCSGGEKYYGGKMNGAAC
jgi:hypothetical protein